MIELHDTSEIGKIIPQRRSASRSVLVAAKVLKNFSKMQMNAYIILFCTHITLYNTNIWNIGETTSRLKPQYFNIFNKLFTKNFGGK